MTGKACSSVVLLGLGLALGMLASGMAMARAPTPMENGVNGEWGQVFRIHFGLKSTERAKTLPEPNGRAVAEETRDRGVLILPDGHGSS